MSVWKDYTDHYQYRDSYISGLLRVHPGLYSPQLDNTREIVVYLPPSYRQNKNKYYPVIYMHDGQNLFDEHASFAGEWGVDETMENLAEEGLEAIVVGIPNMGFRRLVEYSPFKDRRMGGGEGENYLSFIIDTIKPLIDKDARTFTAPEYTAIMGSSMGGLISLYAFFARPDIFGAAGIMSPSTWFAKSAIMDYIDAAPFNPGRIYLDAGNSEYSEYNQNGIKAQSNLYIEQIRRLQALLQEKGYVIPHTFKYVEEQHGKHNEGAWRRRLPNALRFLLKALQPVSIR